MTRTRASAIQSRITPCSASGVPNATRASVLARTRSPSEALLQDGEAGLGQRLGERADVLVAGTDGLAVEVPVVDSSRITASLKHARAM